MRQCTLPTSLASGPRRLHLLAAALLLGALNACGGVTFTSNACEHDGQTLSEGTMFDLDCNQCTCRDGELSCTLIACGDGGTTPELGSCTLDDRTIEEGASFELDCNECTCREGEIACTEIACGDGSCRVDGQTFENGESFDSECEECLCEDGELSCQQTDECTPQQCRINGSTYEDGDEIPTERSCESCRCSEGGVRCVEIGCKDSCEFEGQEYTEGEEIEGECGICTCKQGAIICDDADCAPAECEVDGATYEDTADVPGPRECDICWCNDGDVLCVGGCDDNSCTLDGTVYEDGASVPSSDCNSCSCSGGDVRCTERECPTECRQDGVTYQEGDVVATDNPCESCVCSFGETRCEEVACIVDPECRDADGDILTAGTEVVVDGVPCNCQQGRLDCTPPAGSCESRGTVYNDGESAPSEDGCNTCVCSGGALSDCTDIECESQPIVPCVVGADVTDFSYDAVSIDGEFLTIEVSYSGGCEAHAFELCYEPVVDGDASVHLTHAAPPDPCDALISETLTFDLYPLAEAGNPEVFLRLSSDSVLFRSP